ncbi:filamentous hemagglutinin family protein [Asticcacaulis sp. SL142]|uniref:filamentous haemagglutinin family protein n=1 Tax=Asticcacaulis sp. SL142 TaxID=2995155 RepID=UPI00226D2D20|nr:filamentous haemagglutinin family protein [Asticcacaulis sp. SL142]WAC49187.1 filamentous hemagglutinin family protein [Asticcacaulis sp. SL142]
MSRIAASARTGLTGSRRLKASASLMVLALAASVSSASVSPALAAEPFANMVGIQAGRIIGTGPNAQVAQWTGANAPVIGTDVDGRALMTIQQTQAKALLDWEDFRLQTNEVLEFQQQSADWIAVNRVHGNQAAEINGEIRAIGKVFVLNDNGVLIGKDAKINTRTLVTGQGVSDVLIDGKTTTLVQSREKAILDWSDMSLQAGEVLKFQQQKSDWVALNRSHLTGGATQIKGDIKAGGHLLLVSREGLFVDGKIDAQQVIVSSLDIQDRNFLSYGIFAPYDGDRTAPSFSNGWNYVFEPNKGLRELLEAPPPASDPNDPLRYVTTVGTNGVISTGARGKVMLLGPNVTNKGTIKVFDEGQVILAAADNIYLTKGADNRTVNVFTGAHNGITGPRINVSYNYPGDPEAPWNNGGTITEDYKQLLTAVSGKPWLEFVRSVVGDAYQEGDILDYGKRNQLSTVVLGQRGGWEDMGGLIVKYLNNQQAVRTEAVGFHARNEGIISAKRGGSVDFRGWNLEQMGAIEMTSTAQFRGNMTFSPLMYDYREYPGNEMDGPAVMGHGSVIFGKGSLTQITPDLESTDTLPVSEGNQIVGNLTINAGRIHMQEDSVIYLPSGNMKVLLDTTNHVFWNNRGQSANLDNEDGARFLMERGATIDLSGWDTTLEMGFHQVKGKLYAAQLKDSPLQRDGVLYRQEISVDRRYGTNVADWESFDNLIQGTLAQFLSKGGTFTLDTDDDFIMKSGSVIDVSGGVTTYKDGYVYTTLLRRLDGSIIDIREADPDELYMGLANQWTVYDTKWGQQTTYNIPLMTATQGKFETSYQHGGEGGTIEILAPDVLLQGTLKGQTIAGRYQRGNLPKGGEFILNNAGESETEYVSNSILIAANEQILNANFGLYDKLSDTFGEFFGEEFDYATDEFGSKGRRSDNSTLVSDDFFNRSTMGSYLLTQKGRTDPDSIDFAPLPGFAVVVEEGVNLNLAEGASLSLTASNRMQFLGKVRTEGGNLSFAAQGLEFGANSSLNTRGSWYSDFEIDEPIALDKSPRINGGKITLSATYADYDEPVDNIDLILPDTMVIDSSGGGWADRNGKLKLGKGGDLIVSADLLSNAELDLGALSHARAYGLGGNGAFSLSALRDDILIGGTIADAADGSRQALQFLPSFFENSGFGSISLSGKSVTIAEDTQIAASSAVMKLTDSDPIKGVLPAYYAPSGSDIYDITTIGALPLELRIPALRKGITVNLTGISTVVLGEGSTLSTQAGGALGLSALNVDIYGSLLAPGGSINVSAGATDGALGKLTVHDTARLMAPGFALMLTRTLDNQGRELTDGIVLNGGSITLAAFDLNIEGGAVLDVSGTSATFDIATKTNGAVVRQPRTVASNGGSISISGTAMNINEATYIGKAGGEGARGGNFSIGFSSDYEARRDINPYVTPENAYEQIAWLFESGSITDVDGNTVSSLFGTDLSKIAWEALGLPDIQFSPGYTISNNEELVDILRAIDVAALGAAPVLVIGDNFADFPDQGAIAPVQVETGLVKLFEQLVGYEFISPVSRPTPVTRLSPGNIAAGGFSGLSLSASPGILFTGDLTLGGYKADGSHVFDQIDISAGRIMGTTGADVRINADIVTLGEAAVSGGTFNVALYDKALKGLGLEPVNSDTRLQIKAGNHLQAAAGSFYGYSDVTLASGGDIRLSAPTRPGLLVRPVGSISTPGNLNLKADQIYAVTGNDFTIEAGDTLTILKQDDGGKINASPYEAGAILSLKAPRINQGGTIRSPFGTINLIGINDGTPGANTVTLLPGSLTSVSADGKLIPYGFTSSGDTWIDPITGLELTSLPAKAVNLTANTLDLQQGAVLDVTGGGDLYAYEFVSGIGGSNDWLTGYRDADYNWVNDASEVFAVIPGYDADIAPVGIGNGNGPSIGEKVYLSGGSGLAAGYYTLLPARYALLPGAFRVTANHHYGAFNDMVLSENRALNDGSTIQAGYRYIPGTNGLPKYTDTRTNGFLVMPGETLRERSQYIETSANKFYVSEAFLKKALRTNRPVGEIPRIPLDGGSVVIDAGSQLILNATLKSAAAEGGRGGFADIKGQKIAVVGAATDRSLYGDYLILDSERLNSFGAESLLLGGVRKQGAINLEIDVGATDIVIDNKGSILFGPELLFASTGNIEVREGATVETRGKISGSSGDLRIRPGIAAFIDDMGTSWDWDDVQVHGEFDQGAVLRLSSSEQVDILRNITAIDALDALVADPAALTAINTQRLAKGLAPIVPAGNITVANGATLRSSQSLALDATSDTGLATGAVLSTKQISASASQISVGEVPSGTTGLVFSGGSLGALASADDILLRSYGSIDFHGGATLRASGGLTLDSRQINAVNAGGQTVTISGKSLTLTNANGGTATSTAGSANLLLEGDNIYFAGQNKWLSGFNDVTVAAKARVIGRDDGTLYLPGTLTLEAADITAESGARLFLDAQGAVAIKTNGNATLPTFETLGATLGITGASIINQGRIGLTGGTVSLRARDGNVTLTDASAINVTSNVSKIFDVEVGVGGGSVNLVSDRGNIDMASNAIIDVSGTVAGGDAGAVNVSAGLGQVSLAGQVKGSAGEGFRSGAFSQISLNLADFVALNTRLDQGGFLQSRRFEVNNGDVNITGSVKAQDFAVIANDGDILVSGTVQTLGDSGGRIQLSAAENVVLASGGKLLARANSTAGAGGTVFLETVGKNGGVVNLMAGSLIDVSGTGEGGRTIRLRAPQLMGGDLGIGQVAGSITGARSVIAEGFKVYNDVGIIDQSVIDTVSADAVNFMANASTIQARLGSGVTVTPGIELRSNGDMELVKDWDLHTLRFGSEQSAGVLTLRAKGDLLINANLSDGFDGSTADASLIGGNAWTFNLTAGANTTSPNSLAVLPTGQLEDGKGSIIVGGTADTTEFYRIQITSGPLSGTVEHRLYQKNADGNFLRDPNEYNPYYGFLELERDAATGLYIDPDTGALIQKDPVTGDYVDTARYGRRPLPVIANGEGGYNPPTIFMQPLYSYEQDARYGNPRNVQWDNSTGYLVRTGTGGLNLASGRDLVLKYRPSVIYTAGESAADIADFQAPTRLPTWADGDEWEGMKGYYTQGGGDIFVRTQGDIIGSASNQLPTAWLWRYGKTEANGDFTSGGNTNLGRDREQLTWFVRFDKYQAGIGALGGGNIDIEASGNITNLTVNIPNTGRVSGGYQDKARALHLTGGGDLSLRAGGNIGTGNFYVADGLAQITAGGAFTSTHQLVASRQRGYEGHQLRSYDIYTMLFTSSGQFELQSGGDLNLDIVADPFNMKAATDNIFGGGGTYGAENTMIRIGDSRNAENFAPSFVSYTPDARIDLFSAGGDVKIWNNYGNTQILNKNGGYVLPLHVYNYNGNDSLFSSVAAMWPGTVSAVAAAGNVEIKGGMYMAPSPTGNLDILARENVFFGQGTQVNDPFAFLNQDAQNYFPGYTGIYMSQSRRELMPDALNIRASYGDIVGVDFLTTAGYKPINEGYGYNLFSEDYLPDLHIGDTNPVRIYAAEGDVVTTGQINVPKSMWVQAGRHIYFPYYTVQHNNLNDMSLVRAGDGLYFSGDGYLSVYGPGRLEIETGRDFWIPSNGKGITSNGVAFGDSNIYDNVAGELWHPGEKTADIAIATGYNQTPDYAGFEDDYLNLELIAQIEGYLKTDAGDGRELPVYLFDRIYARGNGSKAVLVSPELAKGFVNYMRSLSNLPPLETAVEQTEYLNTAWEAWLALPAWQATPFDALVPRMTAAQATSKGAKPEFYLPEQREGLVNYVRRLQGLDPLATQTEQLAYLDTAWSYWNTLTTDYKTPLYRNIFYMELRTTGREANETENDRYNTTFRGYNAIASLFPGAQKPEGEALTAGESRWTGDFETYASRIISNGGGKVEFMIPGGAFKLANAAASPGEVGQPVPDWSGNMGRGDALRSGVITQDGGEINIFSRMSVTVNESRVLTTKGGNVLIWSSYGDIAAGKGAKTSITPQFYDYSLNDWFHMNRVPAGLPTGAGIGTLATQDGVSPADVDLIAPNGIVDAGDAGLRVSGNFNVFAVQILGTDNIDVAGISTGLPVPPAAPPTSIDIDISSANDLVKKSLEDAIQQVQKDKSIVPPSLIEVKVTGYDDDETCGTEENPCPKVEPDAPSSPAAIRAPLQEEYKVKVAYTEPKVEFKIAPQMLDEAVRAIGEASGFNILYDSAILKQRMAPALRGRMTVAEALEKLLYNQGLTAVRVGPRTLMLKKLHS